MQPERPYLSVALTVTVLSGGAANTFTHTLAKSVNGALPFEARQLVDLISGRVLRDITDHEDHMMTADSDG